MVQLKLTQEMFVFRMLFDEMGQLLAHLISKYLHFRFIIQVFSAHKKLFDSGLKSGVTFGFAAVAFILRGTSLKPTVAYG